MKVAHTAVASPVFELVKTVELDVRLDDQLAWTWRVEILRDTEAKDRFRCHVWEMELFRLTPSFPRDENHQPAHVSDDVIMVERPVAHGQLSYPSEVISAPDAEAALEIVLDDLRRQLEHISGQPNQP